MASVATVSAVGEVVAADVVAGVEEVVARLAEEAAISGAAYEDVSPLTRQRRCVSTLHLHGRGRIVEVGAPERFFESPEEERTQRFLGQILQ